MVFEVPRRSPRPQSGTDLITQHHLTKAFQEKQQEVKRLRAEPDTGISFAQFACADIQTKVTETQNLSRMHWSNARQLTHLTG